MLQEEKRIERTRQDLPQSESSMESRSVIPSHWSESFYRQAQVITEYEMSTGFLNNGTFYLITSFGL